MLLQKKGDLHAPAAASTGPKGPLVSAATAADPPASQSALGGGPWPAAPEEGPQDAAGIEPAADVEGSGWGDYASNQKSGDPTVLAPEAAPESSSCGDAASEHSSSGAAAAVTDRLRRPSPTGSCSAPSEAEGSVAASGAHWAEAALQQHGQQQLGARQQIRQEMGPEVEGCLRRVFAAFAAFGTSKQR
jgi:hypothetical protein